MAISAPADNISQSRDPASLLAEAGQCLEHIFCLDGHNVFWNSIDSGAAADLSKGGKMEKK